MRNSSYSFMLILLKLHRCFGHGLKMFMWFGYNPQITFCHFFPQFELCLFSGINTIDSRYLVRVTPSTINVTMQSNELAHLSKVYSVITGACIPIFYCIINNSV